jgi:hypothetical protein
MGHANAQRKKSRMRELKSAIHSDIFLFRLFLAFAFPLALLVCLVTQLLPQQVAAYASLNE